MQNGTTVIQCKIKNMYRQGETLQVELLVETHQKQMCFSAVA